VTRYGITIVPTDGMFKGLRTAVMASYGFAITATTYEEAEAKARTLFPEPWYSALLVKIEADSKCEWMVARVVEVFSGRRRIVDREGTMTTPVVDETKATYETLRFRLAADQEARAEFAVYLQERQRIKEHRPIHQVLQKDRTSRSSS
jgi:hypothetical protein